MNKLIAQLQRLYFHPGQEFHSAGAGVADVSMTVAGKGDAALDLVSVDGMVRALVVSVARGSDWAQVAALYEGVQRELDLPAPAIAVSPEHGYQVWFSLVEPTPLPVAGNFLERLGQRYLAGIPPARLELRPDGVTAPSFVPLVPALQKDSERWSAYIDPSMGSAFVEESWCEMAPNLDRQAEMLVGLKSIAPQELQAALATLDALAAAEREAAQAAQRTEAAAAANRQGAGAAREPSRLHVGGNFSDPQSFLLAVMNDPSASAGQRIRAARALLPFFASQVGRDAGGLAGGSSG